MTEKKEKKASQKSDNKKEKKDSTQNTCATDSCCGGSGFLWLIVIALIVGAVYYFGVYQKQHKKQDGPQPVKEEIAQQVKEEVQKVIDVSIDPQFETSLGDVMEESDLYVVKVKVNEDEIDAYITKDFTKFIPQVIPMEEVNKQIEETGNAKNGEKQAKTEVQNKTAKPHVELFVMSHCPYGTQAEKGMIPVFKALEGKIDADIKFVDYAMHGAKEVREQLRQYCVMEEQKDKYLPYVECFLASTGTEKDAEQCLATAGVNTAQLGQCTKRTDEKYSVTALLEDKTQWVSGAFPQFNIHKDENTKYGVKGSPTLVINGENIEAGRDSASLLKAVCSAFETAPEECKKELSSDEPAPGFGTGIAQKGASTTAGCGA